MEGGRRRGQCREKDRHRNKRRKYRLKFPCLCKPRRGLHLPLPPSIGGCRDFTGIGGWGAGVEQSRLELVHFALLSYPRLSFYCSTMVETSMFWGSSALTRVVLCSWGRSFCHGLWWLALRLECLQARSLSKYCWVVMDSRLQRTIFLSWSIMNFFFKWSNKKLIFFLVLSEAFILRKTEVDLG